MLCYVSLYFSNRFERKIDFENKIQINITIEKNMDTDNQILRTETAYYDAYEFRYGDGLYPAFDLQGEPYDAQTEISFVYNATLRGWVQVSGYYIQGLDGNFGARLLERLNSPNYILHPPNPATHIYNTGMRQLYPKPNRN
jgi:hypothetical protein